jgi:uncharacterized protein YjbI with pentapeptide repeats
MPSVDDAPIDEDLDYASLQLAEVSGESKSALEREQIRLTNEKIKIETKKLSLEAAPEKWWSTAIKNIVAVGGILTVAGTAYGLYDSYDKTIVERKRVALSEQRSQFDESIKKLESKSTISKLVAVSVLSGYLNQNYQSFHHQILFTFAGVAATEIDLQTQAAILDVIKALDTKSISPADWEYFQSILVSQSRALMIKGNLYRERQFGIEGRKPSDEEVSARHVSGLIAENVRKGAVPNYTDYRGIYCEACDFSNGKFPTGANFTAAALDKANFRNATLDAAVFNNADMGGAIFAESYLKDAKFRTVTEGHLDDGLPTDANDDAARRLFTPYLQHIQQLLQSQARVVITMPDFSCANLQGAHFENLALFNVPSRAFRTFNKADDMKKGWRENLDDFVKTTATRKDSFDFPPLGVVQPSFYRADLTDAHLENVRYFALDQTPLDQARYFSRLRTMGNTDVYVAEGDVSKNLLAVPPLESDGTARPIDPLDKFGLDRLTFQSDLRLALYQTIRANTSFTPGVAEILTYQFPSGLSLRRSFQFMYAANGERDWDCKTRKSP